MTLPSLSVLLPYRNAAATLAECLSSIRAQQCEDYELLAVDDHSIDDSAEILRHWAAADSRIRCLESPRPGLVAALNHGLEVARADIVVRMDADDRMYPQRLARQRTHLRNDPSLTISACRVRAFPEEIVQAGLRAYVNWQNDCLNPDDHAAEIYVESPLAHPSVAYRRTAVLAAGGYRDGAFPEDYELWLRLHHDGHRMAKLPDVLLDWREYPQRTSRTDPRYARAAFDRLRADYLARDPRLLTRRDNLVIWGAGRRTRQRCAWLLAKGFRPRAWIDIDPAKIGKRFDGAPVCTPDLLQGDPKPFVLVYVTNHGAREDIGAALADYGFRRGQDWLAVG